MDLLTPPAGNPRHLRHGDPEKFHHLPRAHVAGFGQLFRGQGTKPEFLRQGIENLEGGIKGIRDRSVEIEQQQPRPADRFDQGLLSQSMKAKPLHATTNFSRCPKTPSNPRVQSDLARAFINISI